MQLCAVFDKRLFLIKPNLMLHETNTCSDFMCLTMWLWPEMWSIKLGYVEFKHAEPQTPRLLVQEPFSPGRGPPRFAELTNGNNRVAPAPQPIRSPRPEQIWMVKGAWSSRIFGCFKLSQTCRPQTGWKHTKTVLRKIIFFIFRKLQL